MTKAIRQRVRIHDRYQLEIKIEYPLLPSKRTRYHLNTYLFIPHNLAINEFSYPSTEFYRRLQNYIRFKNAGTRCWSYWRIRPRHCKSSTAFGNSRLRLRKPKLWRAWWSNLSFYAPFCGVH
ncbi:MAG: hypothetical protein R2867_05200 [Caldilineaceae bacterium]